MFYWFLKCLLRVSLQSPGIPFFQCIKLYQVTCYSLSQIQLAIKFEYIFFLPTQKDISAFNIRYQNAQNNNNNTPTERKITSNSTTCQFAQVWDQHFIGIMCSPKFEGKTHKDGPTRTARSRSLCVFFVFSREEWKNMSMCFIFAMDFQCVPFFSEILIAKFRFRHSERRWMLVFWKKCPFHAVQEINRMVEELCEEVRGQQPGGVNKLAFTHQWDWDTWDGSEFMAWIVFDHVPGILSLWRLGCKNCRWIAESSGSERVIAWPLFGWFCAFCRQ